MRTLLFNPGPTNVAFEVRKALSLEDMCHRELEFSKILKRVNQNIIRSLNLETKYSSILFGSSGTGCNEAIISSVDGKILLLENGKYSERLGAIADFYKIPITTIKFNENEFDLQIVEKVIKLEKDITHIMYVHHETTTGVLAPSYEIGQLAKKYNKLVIVDAISSLFGHKLDLENDYISFCSVSANKCLESFPGVSFVIAKTDEIINVKNKSKSFYLNLYKQWESGENGYTPYTTPVQLVRAVDVAVQKLLNEGIDNRIQRYNKLSKKLRSDLVRLGFSLRLPPEDIRSNIITNVQIPNWLDYFILHDYLKANGLTIYSDEDVLKKGEFRIAILGDVGENDVDFLIEKITEVIKIEKLRNEG